MPELPTGADRLGQTFPAPAEGLKSTHFNAGWNKLGYLEIDIKFYYPRVNSQSALHFILKTKRKTHLAQHSLHVFLCCFFFFFQARFLCFLPNFKKPATKKRVLAPNNAAISSIFPPFLAAGVQPAPFSLQTGWTVTPVPITAAPMGNALQLSPSPLTTFHHNIRELP